MNVKYIAETQSYVNGFDPEDMYVWLTSAGIGALEEEWDE